MNKEDTFLRYRRATTDVWYDLDHRPHVTEIDPKILLEILDEIPQLYPEY